MPPMSMSAQMVRLTTQSPLYEVREAKGVPFTPMRSKPALQKAEMEWKNANHTPCPP